MSVSIWVLQTVHAPRRQKIERVCQLDQDKESAKLDARQITLGSCALYGEGYVH